MCGITGVFHLDGQRAVEQNLLRRMNATIVHRGPDDEGFFLDGPVGFGVRRLSIVDVKFGHQPLSNEDGSLWIAFNGEIYNHPTLREQLLARGHTYRTNCDTETVIHAYEEHGEHFLEPLCGMFAFAIWDSKRRRVVLCRDRLGIKPLYFTVQNGTLVFASEVKALVEYGIDPEPNEHVLECFLRLGYIPGEQTMFRNVRKLLPGHCLVAEAGRADIRIHKYWDIRYEPQNARESDIQREFEQLLGTVISEHRLGERPQGTFLSGGVDSSAVVALSAAQVKGPLLTFSVGYSDNPEASEFPFARRVAALYKTQHQEFELSMHGFADSLPKLLWHMDEPVADPAAIPLFFIARLARDQITVVHSGEGADEILAGYNIYKRMQLFSSLERILGLSGGRLLASILPLGFLPHRLRKYREQLGKPLEDRYHGVRQVLPEHLLRRMGRDGFPAPDHERYQKEFWGCAYRESVGETELNRMLHVDLKSWLPDDLLVKADKMTMAASIELRVPFLDHRVVEFAARLPCDLKIRNGESKYLLKRIVRDRLPAEILSAPKRGFPIPISPWLRGGLHSMAQSWLLDSPLLQRFLDADEMERLLRIHRDGAADMSSELYGLICLSVWHDVFVQQRRSTPVGA